MEENIFGSGKNRKGSDTVDIGKTGIKSYNLGVPSQPIHIFCTAMIQNVGKVTSLVTIPYQLHLQQPELPS